MPIKNIQSLQPALAELERAVVWVGNQIDDIPFKLVPVIQTKGRKSKCAGWYSVDQWSTREGEDVHEITFCAEELNTDPVDIVGIAVHEVVHFWCNFMQLKDVSTGGRHNKVFKEYAEILGLVVSKPYDSYGYGYTTPSDELRERIEKEFQPDVAAFNLFRIIKPSTTKPVKTNAWICECDSLTLRIPAKQTLDATCHKCNTKFIPKDDEAAKVERDLPPVAPPKKVKKHKHVNGGPPHEDDFPYHEHKEGEGHEIPQVVTEPNREPTEQPEVADDGWDHHHSEKYPLHKHGKGKKAKQHGYGEPDADTDLNHDVDAGLPPVEPPVAPPVVEDYATPAKHLHTENFPFHEHPDQAHGNEDVAADPNLDHNEDVTSAGLPDVEDALPKRKRSKKAKVDELPE